MCDSFDVKIDLCGLSHGGVLALNYACVHPEKVHSLVLIATQYFYKNLQTHLTILL